MNRESLVNEAADKTRASRRRTSAVLNGFLSEVAEALSREERVMLHQFGTFTVTFRKARIARDLNANVDLPLGGRHVPHFIPFHTLKDLVAQQSSAQQSSAQQSPARQSSGRQSPARQKPVPGEQVSARQKPVPGEQVSVKPGRKPAKLAKEPAKSTHRDLAAMLSRAEVLADKGKLEQAIQQYERILEQYPEHITAIGCLGNMYLRTGYQDTALQHYNRALNIDPGHIDTLVDRAVLFTDQGHYDEAREDLLRALEIDPLSFRATSQLGVLNVTIGSYDTAISMLTRALELETDQSRSGVYLHLGKAYCHVEKHAEAIEHFENLLRHEPDNGQAYRYLGMIYDKDRQMDKALEMYRKSNEINRA